jgi:asparagine synthase (glutamine-hydrolysing)
LGVSGIAGILQLEGAAVDEKLLERMTAALGFRGPDGCATWAGGTVGLGYTLLRTASESASETQPLTIDDQVWIVADARVDGRDELIRALVGAGDRAAVRTAPDVELILRAYHQWGEQLVDRLLGDFAFAIWDGRQRVLFCARDHFGVKPFFFAQCNHCLLFSNSLNCIRLHPLVSGELNDLAIADLLLFGGLQDLDATAFRHIARLPPAHTLTVEGGQVRVRRYWRLEGTARIRYRRAEEYVQHFLEKLGTAVEDRLRTERVTILLSGGLDSTAIGAVAKKAAGYSVKPVQLAAVNGAYRTLFADPEGPSAQLAARALDIPIRLFNGDGYALFQDAERLQRAMPEPCLNPFLALSHDFLRLSAAHAPVQLHGQGGDEVLASERFWSLLGLLPVSELISELHRTLMSGRCPRLGIRSRLAAFMPGRNRHGPSGVPSWLDSELVRSLNLAERSLQMTRQLCSRHSVARGNCYSALTRPALSYFVESLDPGVIGLTLETRFPFLDVRLVDDLVAFPPLALFTQKEITRRALRGVLPGELLRRPKTPLVGNPVTAWLARAESEWIDRFVPAPELARFVRRDRIPKLTGRDLSARDVELHLRPLALSIWLEQHSSQLDGPQSV